MGKADAYQSDYLEDNFRFADQINRASPKYMKKRQSRMNWNIIADVVFEEVGGTKRQQI